MKSTSWFAAIAGSALVLLMQASPAHAQATRTWVSGVGDDANPCSRTAPCKTFAGAISKTATQGTINCLDPGGFGAVTITKSITIDCLSTQAGVLVSGTNAIVINATPTSRVSLRGLNIDGLQTGLVGVNILSAGAVEIDQCRIYNFQGANASGVRVAVTTNQPFELHVKDSHILENGSGAGAGGGIVFAPGGAINVRGILSRVELRDNAVGLVVNGTGGGGFIGVTTMDLVAAGSIFEGVRVVSSNATASSSVVLDRALIASNGTGVTADSARAQVIMGRSTIADNTTGVNIANGATVFSYGTNQINGNGLDGAPNASLPQR